MRQMLVPVECGASEKQAEGWSMKRMKEDVHELKDGKCKKSGGRIEPFHQNFYETARGRIGNMAEDRRLGQGVRGWV